VDGHVVYERHQALDVARVNVVGNVLPDHFDLKVNSLKHGHDLSNLAESKSDRDALRHVEESAVEREKKQKSVERLQHFADDGTF